MKLITKFNKIYRRKISNRPSQVEMKINIDKDRRKYL